MRVGRCRRYDRYDRYDRYGGNGGGGRDITCLNLFVWYMRLEWFVFDYVGLEGLGGLLDEWDAFYAFLEN